MVHPIRRVESFVFAGQVTLSVGLLDDLGAVLNIHIHPTGRFSQVLVVGRDGVARGELLARRIGDALNWCHLRSLARVSGNVHVVRGQIRVRPLACFEHWLHQAVVVLRV